MRPDGRCRRPLAAAVIVIAVMLNFDHRRGGGGGGAEAYSSGAPASTCHTMLPVHGAAAPLPPATFPYKVNMAYHRTTGRVQVTVSPSHGATPPLRGFLLQMRNASSQAPVGTFSSEPQTSAAASGYALACSATAATHVSALPKGSVSLFWLMPPGLKDVVAALTAVASADKFWAAHQFHFSITTSGQQRPVS